MSQLVCFLICKAEECWSKYSPLSAWCFHCYLWIVVPGARLVAIYLAWLNALSPRPTQPERALASEHRILVQTLLGTFSPFFFFFLKSYPSVQYTPGHFRSPVAC